ncbi:uncharacterized protein [Palaemon carinicauda]|uniref:uncharacterized protein n=1 Tax=Palaemon carinicauda TaxID=392227 RepID=UPI0035B5CFAE
MAMLSMIITLTMVPVTISQNHEVKCSSNNQSITPFIEQNTSKYISKKLSIGDWKLSDPLLTEEMNETFMNNNIQQNSEIQTNNCDGEIDDELITSFSTQLSLITEESYCSSPCEYKRYTKGIFGRAISRPLSLASTSINLPFYQFNILHFILNILPTNYTIIIIHDGHPDILHDISLLLKTYRDIKFLTINIIDIKEKGIRWIKQFTFLLDIHILIFNDVETVKFLADIMPDLTWVPLHLLMINTNKFVDARGLLSHEVFSHCRYLTLLQRNQRIRTQLIYQIFIYEKFRKGNKITTTGTINVSEDELTFNILFPDRFGSFYGHQFHLSSWVDDFPYMVKGKTLQEASGMCVVMLKEIARRLNFTYKVYEYPVDKLWGSRINGTWRGMIGEVYRGERDFCINVMGFTDDRTEAVDFSFPYFIDATSFVIKNPEAPPRWTSIVFPFTLVTWASVVLTLLVLPSILFLLMKMEGLVPDRGHIVLSFLKTLLRQDSTVVHRHSISYSSHSIYFRVVVGVWWLMAMVLSISYTSNLIAFITIPPKAKPMKTLEELARSNIM